MATVSEVPEVSLALVDIQYCWYVCIGDDGGGGGAEL